MWARAILRSTGANALRPQAARIKHICFSTIVLIAPQYCPIACRLGVHIMQPPISHASGKFKVRYYALKSSVKQCNTSRASSRPKGILQAKRPWPWAPGRNEQAPEVTMETQLALACTSLPRFGLIVETRLWLLQSAEVLSFMLQFECTQSGSGIKIPSGVLYSIFIGAILTGMWNVY